MKLLTLFVLAHLLADFVLQPECLIKLKKKENCDRLFWNKGIFLHSSIQLITMIALLALFGELKTVTFLAAVSIFATHYLIDRFKFTWKFTGVWKLILDQILHVVAIYLLLWAFDLVLVPAAIGPYLVTFGFHQIGLSLGSKIMLGAILVICLVWVSGHLIKNILDQLKLRSFEVTNADGNKADQAASSSTVAKEKPGETPVLENTLRSKADQSKTNESDGLSIGMYIGYLERLLIGFFMVSGIYTGLGLLGTLKTIARFKQLEDRNSTEYFILGTLLSLLLGILFGGLLSWIIKY